MKKLLFLLLILTGFVSYAQNKPPTELQFNQLFMEDGLPGGQVQYKMQDKEGYIWMATNFGLVRFDGYTPKLYRLDKKFLAREKVIAIYEDGQGRLWVGTRFQGLFLYDRSNDKFTQFIHNDKSPNSLSKGEITQIVDDKNADIWLILRPPDKEIDVINCFNPLTGKSKHYSIEETAKHKINASHLFSLYKDIRGNMWAGSDNGLQEFDNRTDRFIGHFTTSDQTGRKLFTLIHQNNQTPYNYYCFGYDSALQSTCLWRYNKTGNQTKVFVAHSRNKSSFPDDVSFSNWFPGGKAWMASDKGLTRFDPQTETFTQYPLGSSSGNTHTGEIFEIKETKEGNLWCVTPTGLIYMDTTTKHSVFYPSSTLKRDQEQELYNWDLFIDKWGSVWLSAGAAGIEWLNKKRSKFTAYERKKNSVHYYPGGNVNQCAEASDHTIWMATTTGLYHWLPESDSFSYVNLSGDSTSGFVGRSVLIDKKGLVWCGSRQGLYCYNTVTKKVLHFENKSNDPTSLSYNNIMRIYEDAEGVLWVGTWGGGLCRLNKDGKTFTRYPFIINFLHTPSNGNLDDDQVAAIYEDKEHTLWVSTNQGSMNKLDRKTGLFTSYQNDLYISTSVTPMYEDAKNRFWLGTYSGGLILFDRNNKRGKNLLLEDGLLSHSIWGILGDKEGNLWIKTARGISIYNPDTKIVRNLTDDILHESEDYYGSFKMSNGLFIFPSKYGFVMLDPNDFKPDSITPVVHIESVVITRPQSVNKSFDFSIVKFGKDKINLKYNENRVTFNYVGLLFQNTAQIQYKYRLDGYDKDWVKANTQRSITYTNLAPGSYKFHVTAANSDGVWSRKDDSILIMIAPPFWQTWWFRTLSVLVIASLTLLIVKLYLNRKLQAQQQEFEKVKAIEKVRAKISMDIHDEISSGLTKISLLSQRIKVKFQNGKEVEPEVIDKIAGSSKEVISNLGEIIWAVNPKHDNLQSLLAYIRNYAADFFDSTSILFRIDFPDEITGVSISPDIKHNVFLVIKEALNNIVKHSAATEASLLFSSTIDAYTFTIKDNGKGIADINGRTFGNGFINMKNRMTAIGGDILIHSEKDKGTSLKIEGIFEA